MRALFQGIKRDVQIVREMGDRELGEGAVGGNEDLLGRWCIPDALPDGQLCLPSRLDSIKAYTLQGPATPLTSKPSAPRTTTQILLPPPSAHKTSGTVATAWLSAVFGIVMVDARAEMGVAIML